MKRIILGDGIVLELQKENCEECKQIRQNLNQTLANFNRQLKEEVVRTLTDMAMQYKPRSHGFDAGWNHCLNILFKKAKEIEEGTVDHGDC